MENQHYLRGVQLFSLGRYQDAIPYFQKALQDIPNDFNSLFHLAHAYLNLDDLEKSEDIANALLKIDPDDENAYFLLSQIYFSKSNFKKALEFIDKAISIYPYEADFFGQKSYINLNEKEYESALKFANEGLALDPNNKLCLNARVQALTKLERKEEVSSTIENLLEKDPENVYSHANVGWSKLENGNTNEALHHFKQALALDPNFDYAREGMSTALKSKNIIYNLYLKYSFWMSKKSSKQQWVFIIGIYLTYRFSVKLLSNTTYTFLVIPIIIAYLLFALGGWLMESLSNAILIFDTYGKYLLDENQQKSGRAFQILLLGAILAIVSYAALDNQYFLLLGFAFLCSLVPYPRAFLITSKNKKLFHFGVGIAMLASAFLGLLFTDDLMLLGSIVLILLIAFTWLDNIIK
ncbi:tetratricopeptide repeat protein [Polaribacter sp. R77954]|uniref:tetratricopeptide repeat protein n=1 Tax=Polaribacter sp. R77954 TaxID=3093870 RepID=UPI0037CAB595